MVGTPIGAAAAPTACTIPAAFLRTLTIVVPVGAHISDGARIVINVKLLLAEGEPAMYHSVQPQLSLQQLLWNNKSRHRHMKGKMNRDNFVAPQNAAHNHRFCLNVDQFVTVALPDQVEIMLVARWTAGYCDIDWETSFLHDVPDGVLTVLHLQLQRTTCAEPAFALERQADALVGPMVHADQAWHLASTNLTDGVELSNLLKNGVESGLFFRRLGIEDLSLAHQCQFIASV